MGEAERIYLLLEDIWKLRAQHRFVRKQIAYCLLMGGRDPYNPGKTQTQGVTHVTSILDTLQHLFEYLAFCEEDISHDATKGETDETGEGERDKTAGEAQVQMGSDENATGECSGIS